MKKIISRILDWACLLLLVVSIATQLHVQVQIYRWFTFITFPLFILIAAVSVGILHVLIPYVAYVFIYRKFTGFKGVWLGGAEGESKED